MGRGRRIAFVSALLVSTAAAAAPTASDLAATRDRPLFSPTRRPPPPRPVPVVGPTPVFAAPPAPPPSFVLSGVIVGGGAGTAIVRRATDASATRVTVGSQVDGWTVEEIRPRSVVLRRADRSVTIDLESPR